jgi:hypothetical protein
LLHQWLSIERYKAGELICCDGDPNADVKFIVEGNVEVVSQRRYVTTLVEGQGFGELCLVTEAAHYADFVAREGGGLHKQKQRGDETAVTVLSLTLKDFKQLQLLHFVRENVNARKGSLVDTAAVASVNMSASADNALGNLIYTLLRYVSHECAGLRYGILKSKAQKLTHTKMDAELTPELKQMKKKLGGKVFDKWKKKALAKEREKRQDHSKEDAEIIALTSQAKSPAKKPTAGSFKKKHQDRSKSRSPAKFTFSV